MRRPGRQKPSGFTLIELLVVIVVSIVVLGAILATLEFALRQETNITARVDANQIGRTVLRTAATVGVTATVLGVTLAAAALWAFESPPPVPPAEPTRPDGQRADFAVSASRAREARIRPQRRPHPAGPG